MPNKIVINTQSTSNKFVFDPSLNKVVTKRLSEFKKVYESENDTWFSELCFCILTANSKAATAIKIQEHLGAKGFLTLPEADLAKTIRSFGHRFHNNKAKYICEARAYKNIKELILRQPNSNQARAFLVKSIKGLGLKEASHFMRNVGFSDVAIIDRHILRWMKEKELISDIPKTITQKFYMHCEQLLKTIEIPLDELDLKIWGTVTGLVLK